MALYTPKSAQTISIYEVFDFDSTNNITKYELREILKDVTSQQHKYIKIVRFLTKENESLKEKNTQLELKLKNAKVEEATYEKLCIAHVVVNKRIMDEHQKELPLIPRQMNFVLQLILDQILY